MLAFFSFPSLGHAFDTEEFANDFYTKIQNKVSLEENTTITKNLSMATSLPQDILARLIAGTNSFQDTEAINAWCGESRTRDLESACKTNLKNLAKFEIDLNQLQTTLDNHLTKDEMWANGTIADSAFDLVVDLNIIDTILFGKDSDIPLARWTKIQDKQDSVNPGYRLSNTSNLQDSTGVNSEQGTVGYQTGNPAIPGSSSGSNSGNGSGSGSGASLQQIAGILSASSPASGAANGNGLQCVDPKSFTFLQISGNPALSPGEGNGGVDGGQTPGNAGEGSAFGDHAQAVSPQQILFGDSWIGSGNPFAPRPVEENKTCKDPLYGGFYCKQAIGGIDTTDGTKNCDPLSGLCKKCFVSGSDQPADIDYCITWQFKQSDHSMFGSTWVEDSLKGYIEAGIEIYRTMNSLAPLSPKQQQNQAGFPTHLWDLARGPGKMLYFASKVPDQWLTEPKQIDFSYSEVLKRWQAQNLATQTSYNTSNNFVETSLYPELTETEKANALEKQRQQDAMDAKAFQSSYDQTSVYYKNILTNLHQFATIFEKRFNQKTVEFPFTEIENVSKNVCMQ